MALLEIVQFGDPRLRAVGEPVVRFDRALGALIDDMIETMRAVPGAGLAAQQIGRALQLCVMEVGGQLFEVVNPKIVHLSGEQEGLEGCLSLEGYYAPRRRAAHAVMVGRDRHGQSVRVSGDGLLARAIQHEYDHLAGILYVDGLEPGVEILHVDELHEVEPD
jgi:peptide deformylase